MTITCPKCDFEDTDDSVYCSKCATPLKPPEEIPLIFKRSCVTMLHPFLIENIPKKIESAAQELNKIGIKSKLESEEIEMIKIAERFHLSEEYIENTSTLELEGFEILMPTIEKAITVKVFLRIHMKLEVFVLYFIFNFPDSTTDDLIFLKSSLYKDNLTVHINSFPESLGIKSNSNQSLKQMFRNYREMLSEFFPLKNEINFSEDFWSIIEIREISNFTVTLEDILTKFSRQIYGLLGADEGWRLIPDDFSAERIQKNSWGSRVFFKAIAHASGIVLVNLRGSKEHQRYVKLQTWVRERYRSKVEPYFIQDLKIAGAEHTGLLLEAVAIESHIYQSLIQKTPKKIRDIINLRKNIEKVLDVIRHVKIPEVGIFGTLLRNKISIPPYERLKEKMEENDKALTLKYLKKINLLMVILAIIAIIISIFNFIKPASHTTHLKQHKKNYRLVQLSKEKSMSEKLIMMESQSHRTLPEIPLPLEGRCPRDS